MARDPILDLFGDDPEMQQEIARVRALRGDPAKAQRLMRLGTVGAMSSDEGLRGIGDNLYRTGAVQEDRYNQAAEEAYTGLKQTRAQRAKDAEAQRRWEAEQARAAEQHKAQMALQWAQERRQAAQQGQDAWALMADPVNGGFVRYNKRTGEMMAVDPRTGAGLKPPQADASGLPPSGLRTTQPGMGKAPTEAEAKSGMRAGVSLDALKTIAESSPNARTPGMIETAANFFGMPSAQQTLIAGATGGAERNLVRGAQDAFIDSALTEMTGAAYTEHQIAAFRNRFMPNYFDDDISKQVKINAALDFVRQQAQAAGRSWSPERDMQFRQMMMSLSGMEQPQAQGVSPPPQQGGRPGDKYLGGGR